jgi:hypothetical protein
MTDKRLEREEEEQAEDATGEEDFGAFRVKHAPEQGVSVSRAAKADMIEDDEVVNEDEEDLIELEEEEEEAAKDAETSGL